MNLQQRDRQSVWHPFTQMKLEQTPIPIVKGNGVYLIDENGKQYIDAISSWWVNIHGHAHPYIAQKVFEQLQILEHVIFAGFTHRPAVELAERLLKILPDTHTKIFYSDNGSTAVEVALKMAYQFWYNQNINKTEIIALRNAYHGDTFGAMSVSDRSAYTRPFLTKLFNVQFIDAPYKGNEQHSVQQLKILVQSGNIAAFIFEPLVQGAEGMKMYEASVLDQLIAICKEEDILCIADEVMTGFGRTGKMFASDYLQYKPDIICLSKGITGGTMALGATSCTETIYQAFYSDDRQKTFFHGHSYTANPLACTAALASLDLLNTDAASNGIMLISSSHLEFCNKLKQFPNARNPRCKGTILAFELSGKEHETDSYFHPERDNIYHFFLDRGILLRPLGNTIYVMPPYCINSGELNVIYNAILELLSE
jgi:adenosylmethionine-8-amino-7-oxononanoate aminotransferase